MRSSRITPSSAALAAPSAEAGAGSVPISWKPYQSAGSTISSVGPATATTTISPITMIRPANQPKMTFDRRDDDW
ncbi:hypothetical protein KJZ88_31995 [Streptomyces sp. Tu102]|nr:hypothetical protein [Streptomyces sp. Tu102]